MTGSVDAFPLPLRPEEVTPEWLSAALRTRYPEARVTSFEVLDTLEGTATKLRTKITVSGVDLPEIVWIKGGFADHRAHVGETLRNPPGNCPTTLRELSGYRPAPAREMVRCEPLCRHALARRRARLQA